MSHPIAFSRAYLLATCFCVFYFYFVLLYRANTYRPVLLHCFNLKTCQRYATAIQDITARTKPTYDWCGVDLNHTWLSRLSSSKLPVSTNYLTAIAFTHSATHQQGESQIWTDGHRFAVCCLLPLGYFAIYNSRSVTVILRLFLSLPLYSFYGLFIPLTADSYSLS